jgi:hypothetical protein
LGTPGRPDDVQRTQCGDHNFLRGILMSGLPVQALPVNRDVLLERFVIALQAGRNPEGKDEFVQVVRGPEPNDRAYFSRRADPRLALRSILSSCAAGRCFRATGLR